MADKKTLVLVAKKPDPEVKIRFGDIDLADGGYNALVGKGEDGTVTKLVTGRRPGGHQYIMSGDRAAELAQQTVQYVGSLRELGVEVADTEVQVHPVKDDEHYLLIRQPDCGRNLKVVLQDPTTTPAQAQQAAASLKTEFVDRLNVPANTAQDGKFITGVDLKTDNLCVHEPDKKLVLVDVFPPQVTTDINGESVRTVEPFPIDATTQKVGEWKVFTQTGITVNALTQLGRVRPDFFPQFTQGMPLPKGYENVDVNTLGSQDAYKWRVKACQVAAEHGITPKEVNAFFEETHFEGSVGDTSHLKQILLTWKAGKK